MLKAIRKFLRGDQRVYLPRGPHPSTKRVNDFKFYGPIATEVKHVGSANQNHASRATERTR